MTLCRGRRRSEKSICISGSGQQDFWCLGSILLVKFTAKPALHSEVRLPFWFLYDCRTGYKKGQKARISCCSFLTFFFPAFLTSPRTFTEHFTDKSSIHDPWSFMIKAHYDHSVARLLVLTAGEGFPGRLALHASSHRDHLCLRSGPELYRFLRSWGVFPFSFQGDPGRASQGRNGVAGDLAQVVSFRSPGSHFASGWPAISSFHHPGLFVPSKRTQGSLWSMAREFWGLGPWFTVYFLTVFLFHIRRCSPCRVFSSGCAVLVSLRG